MIIFYRGTCTITWAAIFGILSSSTLAHSVLAAPEYAIGWLVMQATVKLRQPVNIVLAAALSNLAPALSMLKVSPLLAIFAADKKTWKTMSSARENIEQSPHFSKSAQECVQRFFGRLSRFVKWVEGPIDKYGFSYFLVSKATGLTTLTGATLAAMYGLDVSAALSKWGLTSELQNDAGLFACSAALNTLLSPLHFCGAVAAAHHLENTSAKLWREKEVHELHEAMGVRTR